MRTEVEIRDLYRQYVYRYAIAQMSDHREKKDQFFGAAFALGRTLDRDLIRIEKDFEIARKFIRRLKEENKILPGFREV